MKKILFYSEAWGLGGIERFMLNVFGNLDKRQYEITLFNTYKWSDKNDLELTKSHVKQYVAMSRKADLFIRTIEGARQWNALLKRNSYDDVYVNTMNGFGFLYAAIAKRRGVKTRIVHSHNSTFGGENRGVKSLLNAIGLSLWGNTATARLACSKEAGEYLFPHKQFDIIHNGIEAARFKYRAIDRERIRSRYGIPEDAIVFGNIGRIEPAKNPIFLVNVLKELEFRGQNAYLLLVGDGSLSNAVKNEAEKLSLSDKLIMPGPESDPAAYYSALDYFTLPSFFEGAPIAVIEAITSGVPCLYSEAVEKIDVHSTRQTNVPLKPGVWADKILEGLSSSIDRVKNESYHAIVNSDYTDNNMTTIVEKHL